MLSLMVGREESGGRKEEACLVGTMASELVVEWMLGLGAEGIFPDVAGQRRRRWIEAFGRVSGWLVCVYRDLCGGRSNPCGCF